MLKHSKRSSTGTSTVTRVVIVGLLAIAVIAVIGLREPKRVAAEEGPRDAQTEEGTAATKPASDKFELSYIPDNAVTIIGVRPSALFNRPELAPLVKLLNVELGFQETFGMSVTDIEQFTGFEMVPKLRGNLANALAPEGARPQVRMATGTTMIRAVHRTDFRTLVASFAPSAKKVEYAGQDYYKSQETGIGYFRPDDRTIVMDREANLKRVIDSGKQPTSKLVTGAAWEQVAGSHIFGAIDSATLSQRIKATPQESGLLKLFAPLWEQSESLILGFNFEADLSIQGIAGCGDEQDAETVQKTMAGSVDLLKNFLKRLPTNPEAKLLSNTGMRLLNAARVTHEETMVQIAASTTLEVEPVLKAVVAAVHAAKQRPPKYNLSQITLAMHKYHAANGHFPPAVVIGPDRKTPHSWRVELLPYLGLGVAGDQYLGYKLDEPWDSNHNKQIIEKMPAVYGHENDSTNAAYFVFTGPGTPFGNTEGIRLQDIADGTSNTLMLVEAKRDIPWTKPEDIPYNPAAPLLKLGGYTPGKIFTAKFDGGVAIVPAEGIPEKLWRATITHQGGEYESGDIFRTNEPQD